ncbi:hypothetical protein PYCC9005_003918 [Savitreella phatthalungensis]
MNSVGSAPHVNYLLVAEFDIDRGPTVTQQYPEPIVGDLKMLAELMLPDKVHMRQQDWTVFFLHRQSASEGQNMTHHTSIHKRRLNPGQETRDLLDTSLLYVLNLVNTKHDKGAKRGAQVRALAIVTRHPFVHIYKPVLLLALEDYFRRPEPDTLARLYTSVNAMDLEAMPELSYLEKLVLMQCENEDLGNVRTVPPSPKDADSFRTKHSFQPSPHQAIAISLPTVRHDHDKFATSLMYNGARVPIKVPLTTMPEVIGDPSVIELMRIFSGGLPSNTTLHPHLTTCDISTPAIMVIFNAMISSKRVIFMGNDRPSGIVSEHVLAACVMASGGTGVLRGFTERAFPYTDLSKIEDLLTVPGFIAGVTNGIFQHHPQWWDVLCNIDTGQVTISPLIKQPSDPFGSPLLRDSPRLGHSTTEHSDVAFAESVLAMIMQDRGTTETQVRLRWHSFVTRMTRMQPHYELAVHERCIPRRQLGQLATTLTAAATRHVLPGFGWYFTSTPPDASRASLLTPPSMHPAKQRELVSHAARACAWQASESYATFCADLSADIAASSRAPNLIDLAYQLDKLRTARDLPSPEIAASLRAISAQVAPAQPTQHHAIAHLLALCPLSGGGLTQVAMAGLWHEDVEARKATVDLFACVRTQGGEVGRFFIDRLPRICRIALATHTPSPSHSHSNGDKAISHAA